MTKGESDGLDGVDPALDEIPWVFREQASVSRLDEARARRDGTPEDDAPLAEPIPLRVRAVEPEPPRQTPGKPAPDAPPRPKHAATLRSAAPRDRGTDSVVASREVIEALSRAPVDAPSDAASDGPSDAPGTGTRARPKHAAPTPAATWRPPVSPPGSTASIPSRGKRAASPAATAPTTARATTGRGDSVAASVGPSLNVDFAPRTLARRIVGLLLLVSLALTAGAGYLAYQDARPLTLGAAGTLLAVTLVLYAVRAGSSTTYLAIRSGQLEVRRGKTLEKFDLTSRFTRIDVVGRPGRPGWKVLLGRFGRDPLVISAALVDPKSFMAELERYRPSA